MNELNSALESAVSKIDPKQLYAHTKFRESGNRLRGGCPWHKSKSGTSFVVTKSNNLWWCAGCQIGGGPVQYLHRMKGGDGSPNGQEFIVTGDLKLPWNGRPGNVCFSSSVFFQSIRIKSSSLFFPCVLPFASSS
jgi:hypothetical protein